MLPEPERKKAIESLSPKEAEALIYDWEFWARPKQLPPDWDWYIWLLLSGRGGGKTRSGAQQTIKWAKAGYSPIAIIGQTVADVRDTMVEIHDSAIMNVSPPWFMPEYEPSKRRLTWPNGVLAITYSGDEPDQLRGPQHQKAWADEISKFKYPQDTWDNLMFGLRIGDNPQVVVTTTPKPLKIIKALLADSRVAVTRGHTLENRDNLAEAFLKYILKKYEGTRLGRQELAGEVLDDNPNALWERDKIDELRVSKHPDLARVVVGIDPQGSDSEETSDTGIIVAGIASIAGLDHAYILADLTINGSPDRWARAGVAGYNNFKADRIVGEVNFGGDMVEHTVKTVDRNVSFKSVHASRGKAIRAEPVSALYEQGRVHHVGYFSDLEDQLCLAEGTLVATVNGGKPIQTLKVGDMVWTRHGLRKVEGLRCNGVKTILQVETHLGYNIGATDNHPFCSQGGSWIEASELAIGDRVLCLSPSSAPMSNIRELITSRKIMATGGVADAMVESHCIELCGKMLMGPSLKAMKSIIGMKTGAIIHLTTLPAYQSQEIRDTLNSIAPVVSPLSPSPKEVSRCGRIGRSERALKSPALNAGMFLSDALHTAIFAPVSVISDTIVSINELAPVRVWDLQVAAEHEYFAGGFLVHNCEWVPGDKSPDRLDALVWALTELILEKEKGLPFMIGAAVDREAGNQ